MSRILKAFLEYDDVGRKSWYLLLDCDHWYHWTGTTAPTGSLNCPSCIQITVEKKIDHPFE